VHDFIYITPTNDFRDSLRVFAHQQADATLAGGELGLQYELVHNVLLRGRFDYVWGQNEDIDSPCRSSRQPMGRSGHVLRGRISAGPRTCRSAPRSSSSPSKLGAANSIPRLRLFAVQSGRRPGSALGGRPVQIDSNCATSPTPAIVTT
jgi:hypothetical protein